MIRRRWAWVGLTVLLAVGDLPSDAEAQPPPDDDLVGLWDSESTFGPQLRGELTLERAADRWVVRIAGFEGSAPVTGDDVRVVFPGDLGALRATVRAQEAAPRGFWIQPAGNLPSYATPIALTRVGQDVWRGQVVPLDDRFSIYLAIRRDEGGGLRGTFRNPEMNFTGGASWFRVRREGETVRLADPATGRERFSQPYDAEQRRITMDFGPLLALTPRGRNDAVGFHARSPEAGRYVYRAPAPRADGWRSARASQVGLDESMLEGLVQSILDADPLAPDNPRIHGVLVARRGALVLEEYFYGYGPDRPHDLRSASKTFTSILAGIAIDRGAFSLDQPVAPMFVDGASGDPRRARLTVAHLLTHSSGLACDDDDGDSPGQEDRMQAQREQPDWFRYFLSLPALHEPGERYAYCSAGINLAGGVVTRSTGIWLPEYFDRHLAGPLGIERYAINLMPTGEAYAAGGIHMSPRDFLKFGQLFLDGGTWNGRRIVSRSWVDESTAHRIELPGGGSDGYGWHRHRLRAGGREIRSYEASGNGGQFVIVVPELDLVLAFTAGNYGQSGVWRRIRDEIAPRYVLGAVAAAP